MIRFWFKIVKWVTHLLKNLNELDKLYNGAKNKENDKQAIYYSKLALLELCGWIEESMDDIIRRYSNPKLKGKDNKEYLKMTLSDVIMDLVIRVLGKCWLKPLALSN